MHGKREGMMTVPGIKDRVIETKVTVEGLGRYRISLPRSTAEATQILRRRPGSGRVPVERAAHPIGIGPRLSTTALV
jgi:hypothetical protein